jgi:hypothetical protein
MCSTLPIGYRHAPATPKRDAAVVAVACARKQRPSATGPSKEREGSMQSSPRVAVAAVAWVVLLGIALAQAAPITVNIGFTFTAGGKSMPAGKYEIDIKSANGPIVLRGGEKGSEAILAVMTRLGRHDNDQEPELVFDRIGAALHLSEVWLPGEDGYLVLGTVEKHDHVVLGGPKGKK